MPTSAPPPRSAGHRPGASPGSPGAGGANVTLDPRKLFLQYWLILALAGVVSAVLGVATFIVWLKVAPSYPGEIWFEFTSLLEDTDQSTTTVGSQGAEEIERFIGTQMQLIISDQYLTKAVNDPKVKNETTWAKQFMGSGGFNSQDALEELSEITSVFSYPDSNLVVLRVTARDPNDAVTLVNAVRGAYLGTIDDINTIESNNVLEVLSRQLTQIQEDRRLLEDKKNRMFGSGGEGIETLDERFNYHATEIDQLLPIFVETENAIEITKDRISQWEDMLSDPSGPQVPEEIRAQVEEHPIILDFEQSIARASAARRAGLRKYGPNHREIKTLNNQIEGIKTQRDLEKERLMQEQFKQTLELFKNQLRSLETTLRETSENLGEARTRLADVNRNKEQYEQLDADVQQLSERERELDDKMSDRKTILQRNVSSRVKIVSNATPADIPSFPIWYIIVAAMIIIGVGATSAIIILKEVFEQRIRSPQDVNLIPHTKVLGVIPDLNEDPSDPANIETAVRDEPSGVIAECVRQIRTDILKKLAPCQNKAILVVGGMPGSGSSTTALSLAFSFAAAERSVLIIDANVRRPSLHNPLEAPRSPGLADVLNDQLAFDQAVNQIDNTLVSLLPAGEDPRNAHERLISERMATLIDRAKQQYDIVLIDVAPAIVSTDAVTLAQWCDASLLVVRAFVEKRGLVARVRNQLDETDANFLGVVINGIRSSAGGYFRRNFRATHNYLNEDAKPSPSYSKRFGPNDNNRPAQRNGDASTIIESNTEEPSI